MAGKDTEVLPQPRSEQGQSRPRSAVVLGPVLAVEGGLCRAARAGWLAGVASGAGPGCDPGDRAGGSGSTRTAVLGQAAVLARHGYGTLLLDTRGHGRSGGHAMDFGWRGGRDITAVVSYLTRQPGVLPGKIAALGESMGGEQAIAALGSDPRIRAVVAAGVTGMQGADHGWLRTGSTAP